jgi:uncharacterized membrane protein YphA (DoxX/SURF4 family)
MDVLVLIGRIMFSLVFIGSALGHLTLTDAMAAFAESRGVPSARPSVQGSGVVILVGGLMVLLGVWADLGALLLFAFLIVTAFMMHAFWREEGEARAQSQVQFLKDIALAGAALALFAFIVDAGEDLGLTLTGPLF